MMSGLNGQTVLEAEAKHLHVHELLVGELRELAAK